MCMDEDDVILVPLLQDCRCEAITVHGQCMYAAHWQAYSELIDFLWKPICYFHMNELVMMYRTQREREEKDINRLSWAAKSTDEVRRWIEH